MLSADRFKPAILYFMLLRVVKHKRTTRTREVRPMKPEKISRKPKQSTKIKEPAKPTFSNGFQFKARRQQLDWRTLSQMDVDQIIDKVH
jgi:hypothetical protein